jgi:cytochrome P450 family 6
MTFSSVIAQIILHFFAYRNDLDFLVPATYVVRMITEFILTFVTIAVFIYGYSKIKFTYWKRLGVPYIQPNFPFGNIQGFKKKMHSSQQFVNYYNEFKEKSRFGFGGIYFFMNPIVVPTSLEFLKSIFVKDFQHFHDRTFYYNERDDPISAHLTAIDGLKWKILREKLSPTFTSGKIKGMLPSVVTIGQNMNEILNEMIEKDSNIKIKRLLIRFTTDIIGCCAFGIDCNSLKNPEAEIYQMVLKMGRVRKHSFIVRLLTFSYPNLMRFFRVKVFPDFISEFFYKLVKDIVTHREENKIERNDFMNLLIQLKNTGTLKNDAGKIEEIGYLTFGEVVAQSFVFFLGEFSYSESYYFITLIKLRKAYDNELFYSRGI